MSALLDAALGYAARGLRILPLHAPDDDGHCSCSQPSCTSIAKHPRTPHGVTDASSAERQIREWWRRWPDANIAIATGAGLAVLDIDPRNGGDDTLAAYVAIDDDGQEPVTAEVATGGNGRHLYFRAPARLACRVVGAGLDLKGVGGYVVAPPSRHATGRYYCWLPQRTLGDVPLGDVPEWLAPERVNGGRSAEHWANLAAKGAPAGSRNISTASLAGHLLARLVDPSVVLELVLAWDAQRNRPPLGRAEVTRTVVSIVKREIRKLEGKAP